MKKARAVFFETGIMSIVFSVLASAAENFPTTPDSRLTPGAVCNLPIELRYPEKIPYCGRFVSTELKDQIFDQYKRQLGYTFEGFDRTKFKIDHLIPLCVGGANDIRNLWPQHESIYTKTDKLEELLCDKMSRGRLKQSQAIELILRAKHNPSQVPAVYQFVGRF